MNHKQRKLLMNVIAVWGQAISGPSASLKIKA